MINPTILIIAKNLISGQMMQYGQPVLDDEKLTEMADSILKKEEEEEDNRPNLRSKIIGCL